MRARGVDIAKPHVYFPDTGSASTARHVCTFGVSCCFQALRASRPSSLPTLLAPRHCPHNLQTRGAEERQTRQSGSEEEAREPSGRRKRGRSRRVGAPAQHSPAKISTSRSGFERGRGWRVLRSSDGGEEAACERRSTAPGAGSGDVVPRHVRELVDDGVGRERDGASVVEGGADGVDEGHAGGEVVA